MMKRLVLRADPLLDKRTVHRLVDDVIMPAIGIARAGVR